MTRVRARHRRAGFTLLELLISAGLTATLLVLVWSLFGIYTKLSEKGAEQATELQLARALIQQFRTDLRQLVPEHRRQAPSGLPLVPAEPSHSAGNGSARRLPDGPALIGTATQLQFVIRSHRELPPTSHVDALRESMPSSPIIYDVISYRWRRQDPLMLIGGEAAMSVPPTLGRADGLEQTESPGLIRRMMPWHDAARHAPASPGRTNVELEQSSAADADVEVDSLLPFDPVPEVVRLRFRYSDGRRWHEAWDSRAQQRLPAAIEMAFDLEDPERHQRRLVDTPDGELQTHVDDVDPFPLAGSQDFIGEEGVQIPGREPDAEYRIVVAINPGSSRPSPSQVTKP